MHPVFKGSQLSEMCLRYFRQHLTCFPNFIKRYQPAETSTTKVSARDVLSPVQSRRKVVITGKAHLHGAVTCDLEMCTERHRAKSTVKPGRQHASHRRAVGCLSAARKGLPPMRGGRGSGNLGLAMAECSFKEV